MLKYVGYLGFKYIGRNEIGTVWFFKELPVRDKETNGDRGGYDTWIIGKYPIQDHSLYANPQIGKYDFVQWSNGLMVYSR